MFSEQVLARFHNPRFATRLENATHEGVAGTPGDGPYMRLWFAVKDSTVVGAAFETYPCPAAIACGDLFAELACGRTTEVLLRVTERDLFVMLAGLPEGKEHCARLAVAACLNALRHLQKETMDESTV